MFVASLGVKEITNVASIGIHFTTGLLNFLFPFAISSCLLRLGGLPQTSWTARLISESNLGMNSEPKEFKLLLRSGSLFKLGKVVNSFNYFAGHHNSFAILFQKPKARGKEHLFQGIQVIVFYKI